MPMPIDLTMANRFAKWAWAAFLLVLAIVLVQWRMHAMSPADFAKLPLSAIEKIEARTCGGAPYVVPRADWPELLSRIGRAKSYPFVGWNGEAWQRFETVEIVLPDRGRYALQFATRPSLNGTVFFSLDRLEGSGFSRYGHYRGDELRTWLQQTLPLAQSHLKTSCNPP
jgi:hypothetical protein